MFASKHFRLASLFATILMAFTMVSVDQAEARRGGSFGSRGTRTFNSAPATNTAPSVAPVQRTMAPAQQQQNRASTATTAQQQRSLFGGFGGIMTGLMFGGLIGMMFGGGLGGFGGFLGLIVQVLLLGLLASWLFRRFARPQMAGAGGPASRKSGGPGPLNMGGQARTGGASARPRNTKPDELGITPADLDQFQSTLAAVQAAYADEDYSALRQLTTPEMMSYLSEELGENASNGLKNEVFDVELLQGDVAESWREGQTEYATAAMRYQSIDVTRERSSGKVVAGDPDRATESLELWTFVRPRGGAWKLSAIQDAQSR